MKNKRILAYNMSQKLSAEDLQSISAAGTTVGTTSVTYGPQGKDATLDANVDF
jgi:hypothetical protein